jgi:galactose mutarotase-like enzyme
MRRGQTLPHDIPHRHAIGYHGGHHRDARSMIDQHNIGSGTLSATIKADGAELIRLSNQDGEALWHGGPEWPRHAPVLFPIVGKLTDDTLIHEGKAYRLTQHGFVRDSRFDWVERTKTRAVLQLSENAATLAAYPFRFVLQMIYEIEGQTLSVTSRVTNPGETVLPCGVGAHPAFRWPLADGVPQEAHVVAFEKPEPGPGLGVTGGLLGPEIPLPFDGTELPLTPALFADDAIVIPNVESRSVRFIARDAAGATARSLTVDWDGYKDLGIWSKPSGAPFLCIEPWFGMASLIGWQGEFADKPGILLLARGETRDFVWRVTL